MEQLTFQNMIEEFNQVNTRITKLRDFILSDESKEKVDELNRDLLITQLKAMEAYISVLSIRIGLNGPKTQDSPEKDSSEEDIVQCPGE